MKMDDIVKSTGNVFADLDVPEANAMMAKAQLAAIILDIINQRGLTQQQAADLLGTDQTYISKLKRGRELRRFSYDRLMRWLTKLDRCVILTIRPRTEQEPGVEIQVLSS